ncbi:MAG: EamA family transporter [Anaerolineales bacterium]
MKNSAEAQRIIAISEAVLTAAIWASSFVLVKIGLRDVGPLTIAGFRYFLAFLVLTPFLFRPNTPRPTITKKLWGRLFLIGVSAYTIGNGALFWGLKFLPATTVSFLMSLSPLTILFAGIFWLRELPTKWQVVGVLISIAGSVLFFSSGLQLGEPTGILIVFLALIAFMFFGILGREITRARQLDTLTLTAVPLGIGGGLLFIVAFPLEGIPILTAQSLGVMFWLAVVNTALAYILYNHSLQNLTALEMNVLLNLSPLVTAVLAWWILEERLSLTKIIGMLIVVIGVGFVQWESNQQNN